MNAENVSKSFIHFGEYLLVEVINIVKKKWSSRIVQNLHFPLAHSLIVTILRAQKLSELSRRKG